MSDPMQSSVPSASRSAEPRRGRTAAIVAAMIAAGLVVCGSAYVLLGFGFQALVDRVNAPYEDYGAEVVGSAAPVRMVAHGLRRSIVIAPDGTLWVWSCGAVESSGEVWRELSDRAVRVSADTDWSSVAAGAARLVALKSDGTLWSIESAAGPGAASEAADDAFALTRLGDDSDWTQVAVGYDHVAALKTDGTLWTWGDNVEGQLGLGGSEEVTGPTQVGADATWENVAAAGSGTLAVRADGTLWACGTDNDGLTWGEGADRAVMSRIGTDAEWSAVFAGSFGGAYAVKRDGSMWEWPSAVATSWPDPPPPTYRSAPSRVGSGTGWLTVAVGPDYQLALKADGTLWAWGCMMDVSCEMGCPQEPVQVGTDGDWTSVAAAYEWERACAVKSDGTVWVVEQQQ